MLYIQSGKSRLVLKLFFTITFLLASLMLLQFYEARRTQALSEYDQLQVLLTQKLFDQAKNDLDWVKNDVIFLRDHIQHILNKNQNKIDIDIAKEDFYALMKSRKGRYHQARFIDAKGNELVRVDNYIDTSRIIPDEALQNIKDSHYFQGTIQLVQNSIYFSPFDLNRENNQIELPIKPVIRVSMPVYDKQNNVSGIVIINYSGQHFINLLDSAAQGLGDYWLLNSEGYWLKGDRYEDEWGFMWDHKKDQKLSVRYPDIWQTMTASFPLQDDQFQVKSEWLNQGLVTWDVVNLSNNFAVDTAETHWWIVHWSDGQAVNALLIPLKQRYFAFFVILLLAFIGLYFVLIDVLKAKDEAQALSTAKSLFLANMSHEIRTPLNAVLGILGLLKESPLNDQQKEYIKTARDSGELLLSVINDILDFSKMEAGKLELEKSHFHLPDLIEDVIDMLRYKAEEKNLSLNLHIDDRLETFVYGDAGRIQQILLNIINNAIKFTDQGSVEVGARSQLEADHVIVFFVVKDTGIGIAKNKISTLFEEFAMVDQSFSKSKDGTGLGLAISKNLVELMHGSISVESIEGGGSTFSFNLYLTKSNKNKLDTRQHEVVSVFDLPDPTTKILLVEDHLPNQKLATAILQKAGLKFIDLANNGAEAIQALEHAHYDLILMDISMPVMDGMEATRHIRASNKPYANIPIIALTAHALKGDKESFLECGMNDYLTKPINKQKVLQTIHFWSGQKPKVITQQTDQKSVSHPEDEAVLVDEKVIQQLIKDTSAEIVPALLMGYIEDSYERLESIQNAVNNQDCKTLELETHTLGSSAGAHGNMTLLAQARAIEKLCRENQCEQAIQSTPDMVEFAHKALDALKQRMDKGFSEV